MQPISFTLTQKHMEALEALAAKEPGNFSSSAMVRKLIEDASEDYPGKGES